MKIKNPKTDGQSDYFQDYEPEEDEFGTREVESKYLVKTKDPYGLVYIVSKSGGKLPKELEGAFTDTETALRQIEIYLNRK